MADLGARAQRQLINLFGVDDAVKIRNVLNIAEEMSQTEMDTLESFVSGTLPSLAADVSFAAADAAENVCEVTITVKDYAGDTIAGVFNMDVWLSDAATGAGITGTTASGTVTAKAASGAVLDTYTAKKALHVQTLATGVFILEITDSAKTAFYVCAQVPGTGATAVSTVLATGDYGSA